MGPVGPLQPSTSPLCVHISGTFELTDPSGLPSGHIDVTLKWKFTYLTPGSTMTVEQAKFVPKERPVKLATRKVEEKKVEVEEKRKEEEGKKEELRMVVKEEKRAKALIPLPTTSTASEVSTGTMRVMLAWSGMV